ncbi:pilus assembly protein TadG-related protein [Rhodobacter capsulatus]|uniref:Flp pilus assembly protein TadG n=1 Tax=Rhodobacter capsulatus TaxID=1061 RepID=A0A1G7CBP6_RHOCA|nr:TadE/TadG family type IV pilus assembly protein [Rhodobacter capsulatus]WER08874.1 pilus assembly protein TadG-related protein [Rhodobacter capsulatus]SDE36739.1 Flp pilus assembly protein TadG [Rhodobacter capsulatus]
MKLGSRDGKARGEKARGGGMLRRLLRNEDGALIILSLQIFLFMLITTGIAIDLVRVEERRTLIQNTIDRAVLAAASLSQKRDPKLVVKDYLTKAGLGYIANDASFNPKVEGSIAQGWRRVTVEVDDKMPTIFGPLLGVNSLAAAGDTQAMQAVGNVEISLVLDISGSMDTAVPDNPDCTYNCVKSKTRIQHLREAAKTFVNTVFASANGGVAAGRTSISVVPYSTNVYLGPEMQEGFPLSNDFTITPGSGYAMPQCADFVASDYDTLQIDGKTPLTRTMYGSSYKYGDALGTLVSNNNTGNNPAQVWHNCLDTVQNRVIPLSDDPAFLAADTTGFIDKLTVSGSTSIELGTKWGLALLDPSARDEVAKMSSVSSSFRETKPRPIDYDGDTMKVLVLMTDGENQYNFSTLPGFRSGPSGIMSTLGVDTLGSFGPSATTASGIYYHDASKTSAPYYKYETGTWVARSAITKTTQEQQVQTATCTQYKNSWGQWKWNSCSVGTSNCTQISATSTLRTYTCKKTVTIDVVTEAPIYDVSYDHLYQVKNWNLNTVAGLVGKPYGRTAGAQYDLMANSVLARDTKDARTKKLCTAAKAKGIYIFTIATDAPSAAKTLLQDCSSGPSYYYAVQGSNLSTAFASIAASISSLRLTN